MDEGLGTGGWGMGAGGVEERKDFSPPSVHTAIAASPRIPLRSLVFSTPTATPSRRTLTEEGKR